MWLNFFLRLKLNKLRIMQIYTIFVTSYLTNFYLFQTYCNTEICCKIKL